METDWRYKLKKKLIEFEDGKATIEQIEELVEGISIMKWQKGKPTEPCLFVCRENKDEVPSLHYAYYDSGVLCMFAADEDMSFSMTMDEFYDDGEYFIVEKIK